MPNHQPQTHRSVRHRGAQILGVPDLKIIGALRVLSCATAQQFLRLLGYSPASLTYVQARLKRLVDTGYLERLYLPRARRAGSAPMLYRLRRKSIPILKAQGLDLTYRLRPSESRGHGYLHLMHTLTVNDLLISATILARETPGLTLARINHERDLQTRPMAVNVEGRRQVVVPDGFLDFRYRGTQSCLLVEIDRGNHGQAAWKEKVRGLVGLASGPYEERFKTTSLTVTVLTTSGGERTTQLLKWTAEALADLNRRGLSELFCFAALDPATTPPRTVFFDPLWSSPGRKEPVSLLESFVTTQPKSGKSSIAPGDIGANDRR